MSKKTQILFMNNGLYAGGAEKILQTLLHNLDPQEYDITLYSISKEAFNTDIFPSNIKYHYIFDQIGSGEGFFRKMKVKVVNKMKLMLYDYCSPAFFYKLFVKGIYDAEVAFIEGYSTKIISGSRNPNSKKIAWVHIDLEANHWTTIAYKNSKQEIEAYQKFDHIVSVSKSVQNAFSRKFGIADKLKVKYNPVDRTEIIEKSNQTLEIETKTKLRLVTVGRLENQKGYDRLLEVVYKLKQEGFLFDLWILGEGTERKVLEKYIADHELTDIVTLFGFHKNPYQFIKASDLFVCSSRSEGFSTVVTEALILGKPVVSTNCSGMIELLGENTYGLITKNNTDALYEGVKKMISDEKVLAHYKIKSEERSTDFDIVKTMEAIKTLWK